MSVSSATKRNKYIEKWLKISYIYGDFILRWIKNLLHIIYVFMKKYMQNRGIHLENKYILNPFF